MSELPTVKIKDDTSDSGFAVINESDFDPKKHTKYSERKAPAKKTVKKASK